jgi:hypothetical protein
VRSSGSERAQQDGDDDRGLRWERIR